MIFQYFRNRAAKKTEQLRQERIETFSDALTQADIQKEFDRVAAEHVEGYEMLYRLGSRQIGCFITSDPDYIEINDRVKTLTGNDISQTTDAALIAQFIDSQNMTIEQFCEHYDDNMALARLTQ